MNQDRGPQSLRIRLSDERRQTIVRTLRALHLESFDEEISEFRAAQLLEFFLRSLGPPVYNQAIQDARAFMLEKLEDLEGEFFEAELPPSVP